MLARSRIYRISKTLPVLYPMTTYRPIIHPTYSSIIHPIRNRWWVCPRCGTLNFGNSCSGCGA